MARKGEWKVYKKLTQMTFLVKQMYLMDSGNWEIHP